MSRFRKLMEQAIDGLRSKAAVARNQAVHGLTTKPHEVLLALASELEAELKNEESKPVDKVRLFALFGAAHVINLNGMEAEGPCMASKFWPEQQGEIARLTVNDQDYYFSDQTVEYAGGKCKAVPTSPPGFDDDASSYELEFLVTVPLRLESWD